MKVEEALDDPDWVNAMHEELHNFERNQVQTLVEKTDDNQNVVGTSTTKKIHFRDDTCLSQ